MLLNKFRGNPFLVKAGGSVVRSRSRGGLPGGSAGSTGSNGCWRLNIQDTNLLGKHSFHLWLGFLTLNNNEKLPSSFIFIPSYSGL